GIRDRNVTGVQTCALPICMLWCHPTELDSDGFWQRIPHLFGKAIGCDLYVGRKTYTYLHDLGMKDIAVDYVVVDTLRIARETFRSEERRVGKEWGARVSRG